MLGITIDWDYFVIYDNMWDLVHTESLFCLTTMWQYRKHLMNEIVSSGEEKTFWPWLYEHLNINSLCATLSDSHACIVDNDNLWTQCDTLLLFDQHHDCWDTSDNNRDKGGRIIHLRCDCWGRAWLEENSERRMIWVYPDHLDACAWEDIRDLGEQLITVPRKKFDITEYSEWCIGGVHVCRSGCWSPPWLDKVFLKFIEDSGLQTSVTQDGVWNPLQPRMEDA